MPPLRLHCLTCAWQLFQKSEGRKVQGHCVEKKKKEYVLKTLLGDCPAMLTNPSEALIRVLSSYSYHQVVSETTGWTGVCH